MKPKRRRLDTHMEAAGAEHYVLAQLMFAKIDAFKCERGRAGVDIVAADAQQRTSVSIQVKSRWRTGATGFLIKEPQADFIVFIRLNRGPRGQRAPDCFVFPAVVVRRALAVKRKRGGWSKCYVRDIPNYERYREAWATIDSALRTRSGSGRLRSSTRARSGPTTLRPAEAR